MCRKDRLAEIREQDSARTCSGAFPGEPSTMEALAFISKFGVPESGETIVKSQLRKSRMEKRHPGQNPDVHIPEDVTLHVGPEREKKENLPH